VIPLLNLAGLILDFGKVERATRHQDGERPETDTDHTVMLAVLALEIVNAWESRGLALGLDRGRLAMLALVHDLPEARAGDTNTMGGLTPEAKAAKAAREAQALDEIRTLLGPSSWTVAAVEAYERQDTPEARFLAYLDKITPKLTQAMNGGIQAINAGHDVAWLRERHRVQGLELAARYPEWARVLGPLFDAASLAAETAMARALEPITFTISPATVTP
jgi:5'-deoxynucleotidase YfbR-like HD superfamily hydrolase